MVGNNLLLIRKAAARADRNIDSKNNNRQCVVHNLPIKWNIIPIKV